MPPCGGVSGMTFSEESLGQTQDMLGGFYIFAGLVMPQEDGADMNEERNMWDVLLGLLPP